VSFDEFRACKEREKWSRFKPKSKKAKIAKSKSKETKVSINVGFMKVDKTGNFKKCRGKTLPIKVLSSANKTNILVKTVKKHANHDKTICEGLKYVLRYPDGNEVVKLTGTDNEISLKEYREDLGRTIIELLSSLPLGAIFCSQSCLALMMTNQTLTRIALLARTFMRLSKQIAGIERREPPHHLR